MGIKKKIKKIGSSIAFQWNFSLVSVVIQTELQEKDYSHHMTSYDC